MRRIELLQTECAIQGQTMALDYRVQLLGFIEEPPGGATILEQRKILRVYDALEQANGCDFVMLEDADHETLCNILREIKFKVFNREILAMVESVLEAPEAPA
jgi:hypothetical protein